MVALSASTRAAACETPRCKLQNDPLYHERFDANIPLLLAPPNEETQAFLKKNKKRARPIFEDFFQQIADNNERAGFPGKTFKSCAVVGNSPNLLGQKHGARIDAHEAVFRMNLGPTKGFEADVGKKTSFRVAYTTYHAAETKAGSMFLIYPHPRLDRRYQLLTDNRTRYWEYVDVMARVMAQKIKKNYKRSVYFGRNGERLPKESLLLFSPEFLDYVEKNWFQDATKPDNAPPTSGIISLVFALHACDKVSLFGYGEDKTGKYTHYFGSEQHNARRPTVIPSVLNNQNRLLGDLAKKGIVSIYFPDPQAPEEPPKKL